MPQERDDSSHDDGGITRQKKNGTIGIKTFTGFCGKHFGPIVIIVLYAALAVGTMFAGRRWNQESKAKPETGGSL
jgi:hypothetical protein